MAEFLLPKLGADMTEGRLVEWFKKPGDRIARGDVIAVIETDKANIDVESWVAGTMEKILVEPGEAWMPVGTPLALLRTEGAEPIMPPLFGNLWRRLRPRWHDRPDRSHPRALSGPSNASMFRLLHGGARKTSASISASIAGYRTRREDHARGRRANWECEAGAEARH